MESPFRRIVVAGATGFVGKALVARLREHHEVIALSRGARPSEPSLEWRTGDLFSLIDAERMVEGADAAFYLVHSMLPSARLTQGRFEDLDLITADNFARAAARAGVRQIIFLGGLASDEDPLSRHLRSRIEVERCLASHGVPVTGIRAGLIVGPEGSSFQILARLIQRLPILVCPQWTQTPTQPVALEDVVSVLVRCLGDSASFGKTYDVGGPQVMTYRLMLEQTAEVLGVRRLFLRVPLFSPGLSRLWLTCITGAPRPLVKPLVQSLRHPMIVRDEYRYPHPELLNHSFKNAAARAVEAKEKKDAAPRAFGKTRADIQERTVRSVQRLTLPRTRSAEWVAHEYMRWLPKVLPGFLRVDGNPRTRCTFYFLWPWLTLLVLEYASERSSKDRALFYIRGGWLARVQGRGRFEFRKISDHEVLAAVHDFCPRLPWYVYTATQALLHRWVMWSFGRHLASIDRGEP